MRPRPKGQNTAGMPRHWHYQSCQHLQTGILQLKMTSSDDTPRDVLPLIFIVGAVVAMLNSTVGSFVYSFIIFLF